MSDIFNHYADAIDNYMEEEWDGIDPNPFMPFIGNTPEEVSMGVRNIVHGKGYGVHLGGGCVVEHTYRSSTTSTIKSKKKKEKHISCRNCGKGELHWQQINGKWRLYSEKGELHSCYAAPDTKPVNTDNNLSIGAYKFLYKSDHVEDWYIVQYKGREIGRILHKDKWQWFSHNFVDIPDSVCQSMRKFADTLNLV